MDVGIFTMFTVREGSSQFDAFEEWFRLIQQAEDQGIDTFWIGESHFRPERAVMASPLVGASAVAARTERMKIGLAVQVLPLANPLRMAEETAIVDHISKGRLIVGVGRSSFLESYQGYNIDYSESRERFAESLDVLLQAWRKDTFSYQGEFYKFHNVQLVPKTYQKPHPPIRIAVESRDTFTLAGRLGFPIFIRHQMSVPELQHLLSEYRDARANAGFHGSNDVILQIGGYVANTSQEAIEDPKESSMHRIRVIQDNLDKAADQETYERLKASSSVTYEDLLQKVAFGTPEAVIGKIKQYQNDLGITGISFDINPGGQIPFSKVSKSLQLLTQKVMPFLK
ncbi:MAG: LLM class flavin-dependent oxidoreductase [Chloroflexota bacterium]|nr:LLM class flavin-dependent oxidoreductase [Chloroflexota bacterium]